MGVCSLEEHHMYIKEKFIRNIGLYNIFKNEQYSWTEISSTEENINIAMYGVTTVSLYLDNRS